MADSNWVEEALDEYETPLLRYAVSLLGDVEIARDVVQDTFLKLCGQKPKALKGHLAQWLFRVCRNRAVDCQRKERRMTSLSTPRLSLLRDNSLGPLRKLENQEVLSGVAEVIEALPDRQREVIRLKFQQGLSYKEISSVTGLSVSNVGFLVHTGVKTIRKRLSKGNSSKRILRRVK
jgi:RNA polymerase sigma-70 factor (ECF subfamily)